MKVSLDRKLSGILRAGARSHRALAMQETDGRGGIAAGIGLFRLARSGQDRSNDWQRLQCTAHLPSGWEEGFPIKHQLLAAYPS